MGGMECPKCGRPCGVMKQLSNGAPMCITCWDAVEKDAAINELVAALERMVVSFAHYNINMKSSAYDHAAEMLAKYKHNPS